MGVNRSASRVVGAVAFTFILLLSGVLGTAKANAYDFLGCKWSSSSIKLYVPAPLLSYPVWWNASASWSGVDAHYVNNSSANVYGTNENRGNTVAWTGVTRKKGTVESYPPCTSGKWTSGKMEVVLNWSKMTSLGYSTAKFKMVAAHELGHSFGLAHVSNTSVLMYNYDNRSALVPATDDRNGVNALY